MDRNRQQPGDDGVPRDVDQAMARGASLRASTQPVSAVRPDDLVTAAYEAHGHEIHAFLVRATRDTATAEDLLQDVFLRLTREVQAQRVPDQVRPWLYRVASNLVASRGRRQSVAQRWLHRFGPAEARPRVDESPESGVLRRERHGHVELALAELPAETRLALLLAAEGFSGREVATAIGRTEAATRTLLCRARMRIRERVEAMDREPAP